jgi:hypothetical protein
MTTSYTGNPAGVQAPDTAPAMGKAPVLTLPVDGEAANVSSIYQGFRDLADHVAFQARRGLVTNHWWPGYGRVIEHALQFAGGSYGLAFDTPTGTINRQAFVVGRGLELVNETPNIRISSGFVGVFHDTVTPSMATTDPPMRWALVASQTKACALASAGQERYSLITVTIDAATNVPTVTLTDGTSAGIGTGAVPATPAGHAVIGFTRQTDTAIANVFDCTLPSNSIDEVFIHASVGGFHFGNFAPQVSFPGSVISSGAGNMIIPLSGNPRARLIDLAVRHELTAGSAFQLVSFGDVPTSLSPGWSRSAGADFVADGAFQRSIFGFGSTPTPASPPIWGHGAYVKQSGAAYNTVRDRGLALLIACANAGDIIHGVSATFACG